MVIGGISIKGNTHEKNQDAFICEKIGDSYMAVVSDGLGSKAFSEVGSMALTLAARAIFIGRNGIICDIDDMKDFVSDVHSRWLVSLSVQNFSVKDCYCTCLICIVLKNKIFAARLGDGFIGILSDDKISSLFDSKEDSFINETDCLTEKFIVEEWQFLELPYKFFEGAIVCTDGLTFGENKAEKFVIDFCKKNFARTRLMIVKDLKFLLENWKSHDDKTLSFMLSNMRR